MLLKRNSKKRFFKPSTSVESEVCLSVISVSFDLGAADFSVLFCDLDDDTGSGSDLDDGTGGAVDEGTVSNSFESFPGLFSSLGAVEEEEEEEEEEEATNSLPPL